MELSELEEIRKGIMRNLGYFSFFCCNEIKFKLGRTEKLWFQSEFHKEAMDMIRNNKELYKETISGNCGHVWCDSDWENKGAVEDWISFLNEDSCWFSAHSPEGSESRKARIILLNKYFTKVIDTERYKLMTKVGRG